MKWNGSTWTAADDVGRAGSGSPASYAENGTFSPVPSATGRDAIAQGVSARAIGTWSVVGGGQSNTAWSVNSVVSGGADNEAGSEGSTVSGGKDNVALATGGTIGGGSENTIETTGFKSVIGGGEGNRVGGGAGGTYHCVIGGGEDNWAKSSRNTIAGGRRNTTDYTAATVGGGEDNQAVQQYATVCGGEENRVTSSHSAIVGGYLNFIGSNAFYSVISAGNRNWIGTDLSIIGGGANNVIGEGGGMSVIGGGSANRSGDGSHVSLYNVISGGVSNHNYSAFGTIGGGKENLVDGEVGTVGGGGENRATESFATVSGGYRNEASGFCATVPGGSENTASEWYSFAAGYRAKANHESAFVWADSTEADFASTANNQFLIRASGGVGIGLTNPGYPLTVAGIIHSTTGGFRFPDGSVQATAAGGGGSGDITAVLPGTGLTGGAYSGEATLAANFGTSAGTVAAGNHTHSGVYAAYTHYHDDRYYTEGECAAYFASASHNHNSSYYTETELLSGALDGRYYMQSLLYTRNQQDSRYSQLSHTHSGYALTSHAHTGVYAPASHSHDYVGRGGGMMTGGLGIGREPSNWLDVNGYARFYNRVQIDVGLGIGTEPPVSAGSLIIAGEAQKPGGGMWDDFSDLRLKKNIGDLPGALDKLTRLRGVTYEWRNPEAHAGQDGTQVGMIAQEVEQVFPEWVRESTPMGADTNLVATGECVKLLSLPNAFNAYVVEALKELKTRVETLETENAALKQQVAQLSAGE